MKTIILAVYAAAFCAASLLGIHQLLARLLGVA